MPGNKRWEDMPNSKRSGRAPLWTLIPAQTSNLGAEEATQPIGREQRGTRPDVYLVTLEERQSVLICKSVSPGTARKPDQRRQKK